MGACAHMPHGSHVPNERPHLRLGGGQQQLCVFEGEGGGRVRLACSCMGHGGRTYTAEAQHGWSLQTLTWHLLQPHRPCACMHAQLLRALAAGSLSCDSSCSACLHCRPFGDGSWPGLLSAWYTLTGRNLASSTGWCTSATIGKARGARARAAEGLRHTLKCLAVVRLQWGSRTALA